MLHSLIPSLPKSQPKNERIPTLYYNHFIKDQTGSHPSHFYMKLARMWIQSSCTRIGSKETMPTPNTSYIHFDILFWVRIEKPPSLLPPPSGIPIARRGIPFRAAVFGSVLSICQSKVKELLSIATETCQFNRLVYISQNSSLRFLGLIWHSHVCFASRVRIPLFGRSWCTIYVLFGLVEMVFFCCFYSVTIKCANTYCFKV